MRFPLSPATSQRSDRLPNTLLGSCLPAAYPPTTSLSRKTHARKCYAISPAHTRLHCPTADRYKKRRIRLSPYAEMTTDDWQTYDKPVLRCKAMTTPANSGRKDRNHLSVDVSIYIHILSIDQWVI